MCSLILSKKSAHKLRTPWHSRPVVTGMILRTEKEIGPTEEAAANTGLLCQHRDKTGTLASSKTVLEPFEKNNLATNETNKKTSIFVSPTK